MNGTRWKPHRGCLSSSMLFASKKKPVEETQPAEAKQEEAKVEEVPTTVEEQPQVAEVKVEE